VIEKLPAKIERLRSGLEKLTELNHVGDIRQAGLMAGVELVKNRRTRAGYALKERVGHRACLEARRDGVLIRPLGNTIVLMPPLSVTLKELDVLVGAVRRSIHAVTGNGS
jgi:adenosylmethionine-8-amino-7-oxononanoate aminotransferase